MCLDDAPQSRLFPRVVECKMYTGIRVLSMSCVQSHEKFPSHRRVVFSPYFLFREPRIFLVRRFRNPDECSSTCFALPSYFSSPLMRYLILGGSFVHIVGCPRTVSQAATGGEGPLLVPPSPFSICISHLSSKQNKDKQREVRTWRNAPKQFSLKVTLSVVSLVMDSCFGVSIAHKRNLLCEGPSLSLSHRTNRGFGQRRILLLRAVTTVGGTKFIATHRMIHSNAT
jgi:hypothetical protein